MMAISRNLLPYNGIQPINAFADDRIEPRDLPWKPWKWPSQRVSQIRSNLTAWQARHSAPLFLTFVFVVSAVPAQSVAAESADE